MVIDIIIVICLLPLGAIGWVIGFLCRPIVAGYTSGFNWYFVRQCRRVQMEVLQKRTDEELDKQILAEATDPGEDDE